MGAVIAIGALGGSGTRAIAQVLMDAGIYLDDSLNNANDNKLFTRLFKNPSFYNGAGKAEIQERLAVFEEYMRTDHLSPKSARRLLKAAFDNPPGTQQFQIQYQEPVQNPVEAVQPADLGLEGTQHTNLPS